ncbi:MAG: rhodanese-like domain-containing protein [Verrucomicrobiales bacterium]|nr:rhodanese-like domain-containing protein [Verrucomicrobiales bacterium]
MKPLIFLLAPALLFCLCHAEAPPAKSVGIINVDVAKAALLVEETEALVILDVRTPAEFEEGHLKGAVNIDFTASDFAVEIGKLDPSKTYLMHCHSGSRSSAALPVFEGLHFEELYHFEAGYLAWVEAGGAVEK